MLYFNSSAQRKITWGCSSVGRAVRSQRTGQRFDPAHLHQEKQSAKGPFSATFSSRCQGTAFLFFLTPAQSKLRFPFGWIRPNRSNFFCRSNLWFLLLIKGNSSIWNLFWDFATYEPNKEGRHQHQTILFLAHVLSVISLLVESWLKPGIYVTAPASNLAASRFLECHYPWQSLYRRIIYT